MCLKFAANLNFLFTEGSPSVAEKIVLASKAGFHATEIPCKLTELNEIKRSKEATGIEVSLINIYCTDDYKFGCASVPGAEEAFKHNLRETINFAKELSCKKIHIMSGLLTGEFTTCLQTYKNNLKYAASYLQKENILGLIEPINKHSVPQYFMNSYNTANDVLKEIDSTHLKLMADIFHMQQIQGDISNTLKNMSDVIGHFQIAQVPHRHEPDVLGELDFNYIFELIKEFKFDYWIGCEYIPKSNTIEGLKWIPKYGFQL